jgi:membrane protein DedA with SNARE-associated domain
MLTLDFIKNFVEVQSFYAYLLIILGIILEGEIVVIFAGIFSYPIYFNKGVDFLKDLCYYISRFFK